MASSAAVPFNDLSRHWQPHQERLTAVIGRVASSGWFILGGEVAAFEEAFASFCGAAGCVGVGNGTDALEVALRSVGCRPGDEVVVAGNAGGYATTAVLSVGATPVVVDVDPVSLVISPAAVERGLSSRTRAVVVTHLYGNVVDVPAVRARCGAVAIVEDCSQAHGASLADRPVGSLGDVAAFSFYPTKNLGALGDAGAVVSGSPQIIETARSLRRYGWRDRYDVRMSGGRNTRLDEIQAAVLREFLPDLAEWNERRAAIRSRYVDALGDSVEFVPLSGAPSHPVVHLCVVRSPERARLLAELQERGVVCEVHFPIPDHHQAAWRDLVRASGDLPATEAACAEVMSLPCYPTMTNPQIDTVIDALSASVAVS